MSEPNPPRARRQARSGAPENGGWPATPASWPGKDLGLPPSGRGSVSPPGRRFLALILDWVLSLLVVGAVTRTNPWAASHQGEVNSGIALAVMAVEIWFFTVLIAGSAGQVITRIAVVRPSGRTLGVGRAAVRTFLILLIIPPIVFGKDQRGLHDIAADSIVVRR